MPGFLLGMENALAFAFTQFLLLLPVLIVNGRYFRVGFRNLLKSSPNMDSLIAIGSGAAAVYGIYAIYKIGIGMGHGDMEIVHAFMMDLYFESAGMILTLITLGKTLEARAKGKTSDAITKLMNLAPKVATVEREGQTLQIPVEDVQLGDILIVKAGESIPVAAGLFFLPFALKLNPMIGAFAMSFSSVFVVTNALRLRWFKPKRITNKNNSAAETVSAQTETKGANPMEKILKIEGMMCNHCVMHVKKTLAAISGVAEVTVRLDEKKAKVKLNQNVADEVFKTAIEDAGYQLAEIA